jgi:hypothetical protein
MTRRSCRGLQGAAAAAMAAAGCKVPRREGGRAERDGRLGLGGDGCNKL